MARTAIHLMRHGEVHNPGDILYGHLPGYHLSTLGHQMTQQVADVLSAPGRDITRIITLLLERVREIGAPTAVTSGLAPTTDSCPIEAGNSFKGVAVNRSRWILAHPAYWSSYVNPLRLSWDESYREIVERIRGAVVSALDLAEGHEAFLVSHQSPVWSLRLFLGGRPLTYNPRRRQCALAPPTSLTFEGRTLVGLAYWEPAGDLLRQTRDIVPGISSAQTAGSVSPISPGSPVSPVGPVEHIEATR